MSVAHQFTGSMVRNNAVIGSYTFTETQEGEANRDLTIAGSTTNQALGLALTKANIKSMFWVFDQDVTIKTNSTGSPQETWNFKANVPLIWDADMVIANPLGGNVTEVYVTTGTNSTSCKLYNCLTT